MQRLNILLNTHTAVECQSEEEWALHLCSYQLDNCAFGSAMGTCLANLFELLFIVGAWGVVKVGKHLGHGAWGIHGGQDSWG